MLDTINNTIGLLLGKNSIFNSSTKNTVASFTSILGMIGKNMLLKIAMLLYTVTRKIYLCFDPWLALNECSVNRVIKSLHSLYGMLEIIHFMTFCNFDFYWNPPTKKGFKIRCRYHISKSSYRNWTRRDFVNHLPGDPSI